MKALTQDDSAEGLRIAPLIDVVFLLLIFFLVATSFYEAEKDMTVRLAEATQGEERTSTLRHLVVNVRQSGILVVNERIRTLTELHDDMAEILELDPEIPIVIRCDRGAVHRHFVRVLNLCQELGARNVGVATFDVDEPAADAL